MTWSRRVPMLKEKNLTPFQGLLHAIWTDERISSSLRLDAEHRPDPREHRRRPPLRAARRTRRSTSFATPSSRTGPTLCADCDGRCSVAAGTKAELGNLTRFLTYHEHHGDRAEARRAVRRALRPKPATGPDADLEAAREACPNRLNFAKLLPEVDRYLA